MAKSIGCELYFNGVGELRSAAAPSRRSRARPRWTVSDGEGGVLISAALSLDRAPAYNRVIATGENTTNTTVPRGVWTDDNTGSPTYYGGGFGKKPRFLPRSTFITTDEQAASAAAAIGTAQQGVARSLVFETVPNSSMHPGDLLLVRRTAMGVNEVHMLDSMTIGLTADGGYTGTSRWGATNG